VTSRERLLFAIPALSILLMLADEWIKWAILQANPETFREILPFFSLTIHKNIGLIFDIPFRMPLIILFSLLVGAALIRLAQNHTKERPEIASAAALIIIGALGNIYDRIVYGFTVDYLLFFGRSAINLSDLIILAGIIWLLLAGRRLQPRENEDVIDNTEKKA